MRKIFGDADLLELGCQNRCWLGGNSSLLNRSATVHILTGLG